jgi:glutathione S-transferase
MALLYANIRIEEREVDLKNKPTQLLELSPKATVPVLVLENRVIIEQSLDIIKWALRQSDKEQWVLKELEKESDELIHFNDYQFKPILDNYKYSTTTDAQHRIVYREQGGKYLYQLNQLLMQHQYLLTDSITVADIAIFPFIRQFCMVDEKWFMESQYTFLINWLKKFLNSELFRLVMVKKG